jgi:hypothetical protein
VEAKSSLVSAVVWALVGVWVPVEVWGSAAEPAVADSLLRHRLHRPPLVRSLAVEVESWTGLAGVVAGAEVVEEPPGSVVEWVVVVVLVVALVLALVLVRWAPALDAELVLVEAQAAGVELVEPELRRHHLGVRVQIFLIRD